MITYEDLVNELLFSIKNSGLTAYNIKQNIETRTLYKEFNCNSIITGTKAPHLVRAAIDFGWDSHLTSNSVYGNDCALYHDDFVKCPHDESNLEASIELHIGYNIEVKKGFEQDSNYIYNELLKLFEQIMDHENLPVIRWEVTSKMDGQAFMSSITAEHYWIIDVTDESICLDGIFLEVKNVLDGLLHLPFIKDQY